MKGGRSFCIATAVGAWRVYRETKRSTDTGHDMTTALPVCIISNPLGVTMAD